MKKHILTFCLSLLLCLTIVSNSVYTVYASQVSVTSLIDWFEKGFNAFANASAKERLAMLYTTLSVSSGIVANPKVDVNAKLNAANAWQRSITGVDFLNQSEDEQEELVKKIASHLEEKGTKPNSKGDLNISGATKAEIKNTFNTYIQDNKDVLYYTVHIPSIKQLYPSNVDYVYVYNQIKQIVDEFGLVQIFGFQPSYVRFYDIPDDLSNYFSILYSRNKYNSGDLNMYRISSYLYSCKTETYAKYDSYGINFDDDKTIISDIKNNYSSLTHDSFGVLYPNFLDVSQAIYGDTYRLSSNFMVAPDDLYIKVYTSLANYQNSLAGKVQRKYYYTSNYYIDNYSDSSITSEQFANLLDKIDSIASVLANEERENNYDEDALTRRLDALINAIWSSTGDISDDTGTLVDQNNKALKWYEKIYNKLCDIKGSLTDDTISEPWKKEVTNLVKNTDNDATMNNFFTSLSLTFSPVGESMKTKFPFSMPWDVYAVIVLLCAEPQTPKYTLPFKFDTFGIDTELVVDCSHLSFLATVSRTMLTLLYILGLIRLTTKIIGKGDD